MTNRIEIVRCAAAVAADWRAQYSRRRAQEKHVMNTSLTTTLVGVSLLLAAPAFAQTDPHAGHHPETPTTAPAAPVDAAKPSQMMPMAMPPAKGVAQGGMMADGEMMTPAMMEKCMRDHAKHQRRRAMHHRHH